MLPKTVIIVHLPNRVSGNRLQSLLLRVGRVLLTFSKPVSGFCWLGGLRRSLSLASLPSLARSALTQSSGGKSSSVRVRDQDFKIRDVPRHKKFETPRRKSPDLKNESLRPIENASEISRSRQNFPIATVFRGTISIPTLAPEVRSRST